MDKKPYYITTAIAYTSRKPHVGNSYEIVLTDAIARFKRMQGFDVYFQTGTDEHGLKIEQYAEEAGISPKAYVDKVSGEIKAICDKLNTTYDRFIRTTDDDHVAAVQKIFQKLYGSTFGAHTNSRLEVRSGAPDATDAASAAMEAATQKRIAVFISTILSQYGQFSDIVPKPP